MLNGIHKNWKLPKAESDSTVRKRQKEKACKRFNKQPNIFDHLPWNDRKIKLEKFNVLHHLIVSEKHKVLFCYIPKISCSNVKKIFVVLNGLYPDLVHVDGRKLNRDVVRLHNYKRFNKDKVLDMLKNYYKFMLVRDPFERLVSAYRNKWADKVNVELHGGLGKKIVRRYRLNGNKDSDPRGDDVTFTEYARYLIDTPSKELNEHWMPYNDLCRPCDINYDFIGSIDTVSRDVTHAMRQIKVDETQYYMRRGRKGGLVETKKVMEKFLRELPENVFNQLVQKFQFDYQLFGYKIPEYKKLHA